MTLGSRRAARRPGRRRSSSERSFSSASISIATRARRVAMGQRVRYVTFACVVLLAAHLLAQSQIPSSIPPPTWIPDIKFASGRNVVPYLEGWIRNLDESFDFVFGYFNRNT